MLTMAFIHRRKYRFPNRYTKLNGAVVVGTAVAMAAAVTLSIVGALHVYEATMADPPKMYDATYYNMWKAGSSLVVVVWGFQVGWCAWSYIDRKGRTMGPEEKYTTIVSSQSSHMATGRGIGCTLEKLKLISFHSCFMEVPSPSSC